MNIPAVNSSHLSCVNFHPTRIATFWMYAVTLLLRRLKETKGKQSKRRNPHWMRWTIRRLLHHKTSDRAPLNATLSPVPLINGRKLHIVLLTRKCQDGSVPSYRKMTVFILMPLYTQFWLDAVITFVFRKSTKSLPWDLFILLMRWNLTVFLVILNQRNRSLYCIFTDVL